MHVYHTARGLLPARAAYEALGVLIVDPRTHCTLAGVRTHIRLWAAWRRGLLQDDAWHVVPGTPPGPDDPPTPAG